tara:strand:- start:987 stop:1154 length:168 start_codon:yes stop_codon:yes gene_type:complete
MNLEYESGKSYEYEYRYEYRYDIDKGMDIVMAIDIDMVRYSFGEEDVSTSTPLHV